MDKMIKLAEVNQDAASNVVLAFISGVISIVVAIYLFLTKVNRLEWRVQNLEKTYKEIHEVKEFLVRRAIAEGVVKGVIKVESPIQIVSRCREYLKPLEIELKSYYKAHQEELFDVDEKKFVVNTVMAIDRVFGNRLIDIICKPYQLSEGACVVAGATVAVEPLKLDWPEM